MKIFGESTQKARVEHFCDHCFNWIMPGDIYERYVWMPTPDRAFALKRHSQPGCPPEMYAPVEEEPIQLAISYVSAIRIKTVLRIRLNGTVEACNVPEMVFVPKIEAEPEPPPGLDYDDDIPF